MVLATEWKWRQILKYALTSQIRRAAVNKENLKALKDDTKEVEGMLKALIKSFENKRLNQRGKGFGEELRQL